MLGGHLCDAAPFAVAFLRASLDWVCVDNNNKSMSKKKPKFTGLGTLEDILRAKFATDKDAMYEPVHFFATMMEAHSDVTFV